MAGRRDMRHFYISVPQIITLLEALEKQYECEWDCQDEVHWNQVCLLKQQLEDAIECEPEIIRNRKRKTA